MAKVVIYLRISSNEETIENQLPALQKWVADRRHEKGIANKGWVKNVGRF